MAAATPLETSIVIDHPTAQVAELERRTDPLVVRADAFVIESDIAYETAADFLRDCKAMQKDIREAFEEPVKKAHEAHKAMTGLRGKLLSPIEAADKRVKAKMAGWVEAKERAAREEEQRRQAEARKAEEDRRLAEAAQLEAQGRQQEADAALAAPVHVPAQRVVAAPPKVEGTAVRKKYGAKVVDLDALVRAVAAGKVPLTLICPNQRALDSLAQAGPESFAIPGCELVTETVIAARGR